LRTLTYKIAFISSLCFSALALTACQTPDLGKKDPEKAAKVRTQLAVEYIKAGDLDAAKRALDQALETQPRDAQANMMMGVLLQQEGSPLNMEKADSYFRRAISAEPKNAQARNNYGTYLYQIERYNDALEQLNIAAGQSGFLCFNVRAGGNFLFKPANRRRSANV